MNEGNGFILFIFRRFYITIQQGVFDRFERIIAGVHDVMKPDAIEQRPEDHGLVLRILKTGFGEIAGNDMHNGPAQLINLLLDEGIDLRLQGKAEIKLPEFPVFLEMFEHLMKEKLQFRLLQHTIMVDIKDVQHLFYPGAEDLPDDLLLALEIIVHQTFGYTGFAGYLTDGGTMVALMPEQLQCRFQYPGPLLFPDGLKLLFCTGCHKAVILEILTGQSMH
jgi:hypothetical protein